MKRSIKTSRVLIDELSKIIKIYKKSDLNLNQDYQEVVLFIIYKMIDHIKYAYHIKNCKNLKDFSKSEYFQLIKLSFDELKERFNTIYKKFLYYEKSSYYTVRFYKLFPSRKKFTYMIKTYYLINEIDISQNLIKKFNSCDSWSEYTIDMNQIIEDDEFDQINQNVDILLDIKNRKRKTIIQEQANEYDKAIMLIEEYRTSQEIIKSKLIEQKKNNQIEYIQKINYIRGLIEGAVSYYKLSNIKDFDLLLN